MAIIRQLATIFGPILVGTKGPSMTVSVSKSNWEAAICELLMYATDAGFNTSSHHHQQNQNHPHHHHHQFNSSHSSNEDLEESLLWRIPTSLNEQIVSRTPSKRCTPTSLTPRKQTPKTAAARRLFGSTPKRLFGSPNANGLGGGMVSYYSFFFEVLVMYANLVQLQLSSS
jgi:hypothetical protein